MIELSVHHVRAIFAMDVKGAVGCPAMTQLAIATQGGEIIDLCLYAAEEALLAAGAGAIPLVNTNSESAWCAANEYVHNGFKLPEQVPA